MTGMKVVARVFRALLEIVLPHTRDRALVEQATHASLAALVRPSTHRGIVSLLPYRDDLVRALVWQLKYRKDMRAAELLGSVLASHLILHTPDISILVPVPLSPERLRERGYNQVSLVLREALACGVHGSLREDLLVRAGGRQPQTRLTREARLRNVAGVFSVAHRDEVLGRDILLIDDVTTTGSTLNAARSALVEAGAARVVCIALAH